MAGLGPSTYPSTFAQPTNGNGPRKPRGSTRPRPEAAEEGRNGKAPKKSGHSPQGRRRGRTHPTEEHRGRTGDSAAPPAGRDDRAKARRTTAKARSDEGRGAPQTQPDQRGRGGQPNRGARATGTRSGAAKAQARHQKRPKAAHRRGTAACS